MILIIVIASILGSSGLIPSTPEVYSWQFEWAVPFGIILMLLAFNPINIFKRKKELYEKGFKNIYLSTGYQNTDFSEMYWIKEIVGKLPPF